MNLLHWRGDFGSKKLLTVEVGDARRDEGGPVRTKLDAGNARRGGRWVGCGAGEAAPAEGLATGGGHGSGAPAAMVCTRDFRVSSLGPLLARTGRCGTTICFGQAHTWITGLFV